MHSISSTGTYYGRSSSYARQSSPVVKEKMSDRSAIAAEGAVWQGKLKLNNFWEQVAGTRKKLIGGLKNTWQDQIEKEVEAEFEKQKHRYRPESVDDLVSRTKFTRKEIQVLYRSFKENCPNGLVTLEKFQQIMAGFFYFGNSDSYAQMVFHTFDEDGNGEISFAEFVSALSVLWRGTSTQKLEWIFSLYDHEQHGCIRQVDVERVVEAVYALIGPHASPAVSDSDIHEHAMDVFKKMDINGDGEVSLEEFLRLCESDATVGHCLELLGQTNIHGFGGEMTGSIAL